MEADRDRTRLLAEEVSGLAYEALAPEDMEQVKRLLLDHVGVAWRGSDMPWSRALAGWAATLGNGGGCPIVGTSVRAAPSISALVNASAAHGMELDDTHDESLSHPGAPVIATAFAAGSAAGAPGEAVIAAVADKIAGLLVAMDGAPEVDALADAVWSLEETDGLTRLAALLCVSANA